jgi:hypothetical protein
LRHLSEIAHLGKKSYEHRNRARQRTNFERT